LVRTELKASAVVCKSTTKSTLSCNH